MLCINVFTQLADGRVAVYREERRPEGNRWGVGTLEIEGNVVLETRIVKADAGLPEGCPFRALGVPLAGSCSCPYHKDVLPESWRGTFGTGVCR